MYGIYKHTKPLFYKGVFETRCSKCKCKFVFENEDIIYKTNMKKSFTYCPNCDDEICIAEAKRSNYTDTISKPTGIDPNRKWRMH